VPLEAPPTGVAPSRVPSRVMACPVVQLTTSHYIATHHLHFLLSPIRSAHFRRICRKYTYWTIAFFAFVIVAIGGSSGDGETKQQKRAKKLRNKAETMPEVEVERLKAMKIKADLNDKYAKLNDAHANYEDSEDAGLNNGAIEDEDDLNKELTHAFDDVEMAEQDEIDTNNSMLTTAVKTMEDSVKFYLGKVFGYEDDEDDDDAVSTGASEDIKLTEDQLEDIAKKISARLEKDVKTEFREKADNVKEEKMSEIEKVVAEDREAQMPARDVRVLLRYSNLEFELLYSRRLLSIHPLF